MPCDKCNFIDIYIEGLSKTSNYCISNKVTYCVIGGALNTDLNRRRSNNRIAFNKCLADECLNLCLHSDVFWC